MSYLQKTKRAVYLMNKLLELTRQHGIKGALDRVRSHPKYYAWFDKLSLTRQNRTLNDFKNPFKQAFEYHKQPVDLEGKKQSIVIACAQGGNFFMFEIAKLLGCSLSTSNHSVEHIDENSIADCALMNKTLIIVAPHEFFILGNATQLMLQIKQARRVIMLNTEQSQTSWFAAALPFLKSADVIWDMNFQSAVVLRSNGLNSYFLPLGFCAEYSASLELDCPLKRTLPLMSLSTSVTDHPPVNFKERPIDILFVGTMSEKRKLFFAQHAAFFAQFECFLYLPEGNKPFIVSEDASINFEQMAKLIQRSKIMINVHRDDDTYLEWQRIVNLGMTYGALVISESCDQSPALSAGLDYVDIPLELLTETCEFYLNHLDIAEKFSLRAQKHAQQMDLAKSLNQLLSQINE